MELCVFPRRRKGTMRGTQSCIHKHQVDRLLESKCKHNFKMRVIVWPLESMGGVLVEILKIELFSEAPINSGPNGRF